MTVYFENFDFESEYNEIFSGWYEIKGVRKIKELSRQLRTFFNYKMAVIRYRFRSDLNSLEEELNITSLTQKKSLESLSYEFLTLLKKIKHEGYPLEDSIRLLYCENNEAQIDKLSAIMEKISILIHYFSEESIRDHPRFLKFIVVLAQNISMVKKCLYTQFSEFYRELEINYNSLEQELERLLEKTPDMKSKKPIKQLEKKLIS